MPLTHLHIPQNVSAERARMLADAAHTALVETCGVPPKDRFQLITRYNADAMILDPTFPNVERSGEASIIEITFLAGRTPTQKRALYHTLVDLAVAGGFRADDVMIALTENTPLDWSLGRGEAYADEAHA
ncbi:MAG: tautomerase family protein [Elstera sp.]